MPKKKEAQYVYRIFKNRKKLLDCKDDIRNHAIANILFDYFKIKGPISTFYIVPEWSFTLMGKKRHIELTTGVDEDEIFSIFYSLFENIDMLVKQKHAFADLLKVRKKMKIVEPVNYTIRRVRVNG